MTNINISTMERNEAIEEGKTQIKEPETAKTKGSAPIPLKIH